MFKQTERSKTIIDIAKRANVSITTVSRVMNNPELVKDETRLKVQQVINELNYMPNALARGLIKKSTKTIGVVMQDINNIFFPAVIRGIEDILVKNGHNIFLCNTDGDIKKEINHLNSLIERRVDGIIMMGTRPAGVMSNQHIFKLAKEIPIVLLFDTVTGLDVYSVKNDEVQGAYDAVNYLASIGHKKIAFINGEGNFTTYFYKQTGYQKALLDNGLPINLDYEIRVASYEIGGHKGINMLLDMDDKPTAVFTASDQFAIGVYKGAYERGYKIPDDLSVIGFGGIPLAKEMYPELTTVNQFPYISGRTAAEVMVKTIEGENPDDKNIIICTELVKRKSCKEIEC